MASPSRAGAVSPATLANGAVQNGTYVPTGRSSRPHGNTLGGLAEPGDDESAAYYSLVAPRTAILKTAPDAELPIDFPWYVA